MLGILSQETSPDVVKYRNALLRRYATESEIQPSRLPIPDNITEMGGYFNQLMKLRETGMLKQMLASALGLPMIQLSDGYSEA